MNGGLGGVAGNPAAAQTSGVSGTNAKSPLNTFGAGTLKHSPRASKANTFKEIVDNQIEGMSKADALSHLDTLESQMDAFTPPKLSDAINEVRNFVRTFQEGAVVGSKTETGSAPQGSVDAKARGSDRPEDRNASSDPSAIRGGRMDGKTGLPTRQQFQAKEAARQRGMDAHKTMEELTRGLRAAAMDRAIKGNN